EFLRVHVNDPDRQFEHLQNIINDFHLPDLASPLPITLLRRILSQLLISKIRPRLAFQPIKPKHALQLDLQLAHRVHDHLRYPFHFNSSLLSLPLKMLGFDFPSISRINDAAAVNGLQRDLNHHIPYFRSMALITLNDWSCSLNHCKPPFAPESKSFRRSTKQLPWSWILAHSVLRRLGISIIHTDQSYILRGDVSLRHVYNIVKSSSRFLNANMIHLLSLNGVNLLSDLGQWSTHVTHQPVFHVSASALQSMQFTSVRTHWNSIRNTFDMLPISAIVSGDWHLALPRAERRERTENVIRYLASSSRYPITIESGFPSACDASSLPANVSLNQSRSVTIASLSENHSLVCSLTNHRLSATILLGEVYALLITALLSFSSPHSEPQVIVSDHLNTVNIINQAFAHPPSAHSWNTLPARSLYRWLLVILQDMATPPQIIHAKAHTTSRDPNSIVNDAADSYATKSQTQHIIPPPLPVPTFSLDEFAFFHPSYSYIEQNISSFIMFLDAYD
ncbi:hypothetical protein BJ138DRAFT_1186025, partial [Hygrophoropsis aurantiaca]